MPPHPEQPSPGRTAHSHLPALLMTLPPESVRVVEQFVPCLSAPAQQGQPLAIAAAHEAHMSCRSPTIPVPAAMLDGLLGMVPPVGGNALADTEALYEVV